MVDTAASNQATSLPSMLKDPVLFRVLNPPAGFFLHGTTKFTTDYSKIDLKHRILFATKWAHLSSDHAQCPEKWKKVRVFLEKEIRPKYKEGVCAFGFVSHTEVFNLRNGSHVLHPTSTGVYDFLLLAFFLLIVGFFSVHECSNMKNVMVSSYMYQFDEIWQLGKTYPGRSQQRLPTVPDEMIRQIIQDHPHLQFDQMFEKKKICHFSGDHPTTHHALAIDGVHMMAILEGIKNRENRKNALPIEGAVGSASSVPKSLQCCMSCPLQNYGIDDIGICPDFYRFHRLSKLDANKERARRTNVQKWQKLHQEALQKYGQQCQNGKKNLFISVQFNWNQDDAQDGVLQQNVLLTLMFQFPKPFCGRDVNMFPFLKGQKALLKYCEIFDPALRGILVHVYWTKVLYPGIVNAEDESHSFRLQLQCDFLPLNIPGSMIRVDLTAQSAIQDGDECRRVRYCNRMYLMVPNQVYMESEVHNALASKTTSLQVIAFTREDQGVLLHLQCD